MDQKGFLHCMWITYLLSPKHRLQESQPVIRMPLPLCSSFFVITTSRRCRAMRDDLENPGQEPACPECKLQEGRPQGDLALCHPHAPAQGHLPVRVDKWRILSKVRSRPSDRTEGCTGWPGPCTWDPLVGLGNSPRVWHCVTLHNSSAGVDVEEAGEPVQASSHGHSKDLDPETWLYSTHSIFNLASEYGI